MVVVVETNYSVKLKLKLNKMEKPKINMRTKIREGMVWGILLT